MSARTLEGRAMDAANASLCASVEMAMLEHLRNAPDFQTGRIHENALLKAAYIQSAAVIHAAGLQAIARVEAAQITAAAMDRRTAATQRRIYTRSE
ncbi:hypothetical protein [Acidovorax sp.]|uniref:hypothetical protein n=1 Tax=Acidovorax sp. TaxID=1872122 RepID=UPI002F993474